MPRSIAALALSLLFALFALAPGVASAQDEAEEQGSKAAPYEASPPPGAAPAGAPAGKKHRGDHLTIYVLTFSPGDHPFFKFGHNAIWIHDAIGDRKDKVYNWGTFTFSDPALIPKFVVGRFMYWLSVQTLQGTKNTYRRENRWVDAQELDLTPEQKVALRDAVEKNLAPDEKYYKYDYFRDNCSTRVRDHVDRAIGGRLKEAGAARGRLPLRGHMLRVTEDTPFFATILSLALADLIDKPSTRWDEAFLPGELQGLLRDTKVEGPDGALRPLVKGEERMVTAKRAETPVDPPRWLHWFLLSGLALGGALFALGRAASRGARGARIALGLLVAGASVILGFLGLFFLFVWFLTDHGAGYGNENMFVTTPFAWLLIPSAIGVARGKTAAYPRAAKIALAAAALAVLGVVVKVLPWFDQDNLWFLALFVPPWLATAWSFRALAGGSAVTPPAAAPPPAKAKARTKKDAPPPEEPAGAPPPAAFAPGAAGS